MPRVPVHGVEDAPQASVETLRKLEKHYGMVLNIHGEMAHSPLVLAAYEGINAAIAEQGTFDATTTEAIALAVGAVNRCDYCQAAHTALGTAVGLGAGQMVAIRAGRAGDDAKLEALLAVARQIAADAGEVNEAAWDAALAVGWSEVELADLFVYVIGNIYTNYFNHYVHTDLDLPAAPALES
jgi:AhpD family alkylhydroperoxidase